MNQYPEIPEGFYCYAGNQLCPHFSHREINGVFLPYCELLKHGSIPANLKEEEVRSLIEVWGIDPDSNGGYFEAPEEYNLFLLWDQCKECGINYDISEEN